MKGAPIKLLVGIAMLLSSARGASFTGYLKTKHSKAIAFCNLRAISNSGEIREFSTDRGGSFSVELIDGSWTILADVDQIRDWGFAQMEGVSITITGDADLVENLTLYASEPLQIPSLTFTRPDPRTWRFSVRGQGGTVVRIYSSTDLKTWALYNSVALGTTGQSISSSTSSHENVRQIYFKASASTE